MATEPVLPAGESPLDKETVDLFLSNMEPRGGTPEELDKFIKAEADRWLPVLRGLNLPKQSH